MTFRYKLSDLFQDLNLDIIQCLIIENLIAASFVDEGHEIDAVLMMCDNAIRIELGARKLNEKDLRYLDVFLSQFNEKYSNLVLLIRYAAHGEYGQIVEDLEI